VKIRSLNPADMVDFLDEKEPGRSGGHGHAAAEATL
jgi:hypothetical protein